MLTFRGYARAGTPAGIRNQVLILSAELSCNPWAIEIASRVPGCFAVTHQQGLGNVGVDRDMVTRILSNIAVHPNVAGLIVLASGNEDYDAGCLTDRAKLQGRMARLIGAGDVADAGELVEKGVAAAGDLLAQASMAKRVEVSLSELRIGLNCAGTDGVSAATSHAVCGAAMDRLVACGATVVLSEIPEMIGLGEAFFERAAGDALKGELRSLVSEHKRRLLASGEEVDEAELCAFNRQGGVSSLEMKAKISVMKGGRTPITQVNGYGQVPTRSGLVVMDGPALTDFVMTGYLGAGIHLMVNCCGCGAANQMPFLVGASGSSPLLPVIKVTGSAAHFQRATNRIDFDASVLLDRPDEVAGLAERLGRLIGATASGQPTRTETMRDFSLNFPMRFHQA
jgi:altronate dehydratase large subunit